MISIFNERKRSLGGERADVHVRVDVGLREHLHLFKGAKLAVLLAIALHQNGRGWAFPSISLLAKETGYDRETIFAALDSLCAVTVNGERILLKARLFKESGTFDNSCYLLFPSKAEATKYEGQRMRRTAGNQVELLPSREKADPAKTRLGKTPTLRRTTLKEETLSKEETVIEGSADARAVSPTVPLDSVPLEERTDSTTFDFLLEAEASVTEPSVTRQTGQSPAGTARSVADEADYREEPVVQVFKRVMGRLPNAVQRREICLRVNDSAEWEALLREWQLKGYNPKNVAGMLDALAHPDKSPLWKMRKTFESASERRERDFERMQRQIVDGRIEAEMAVAA